jgi:hypothetical protein
MLTLFHRRIYPLSQMLGAHRTLYHKRLYANATVDFKSNILKEVAPEYDRGRNVGKIFREHDTETTTRI